MCKLPGIGSARTRLPLCVLLTPRFSLSLSYPFVRRPEVGPVPVRGPSFANHVPRSPPLTTRRRIYHDRRPCHRPSSADPPSHPFLTRPIFPDPSPSLSDVGELTSIGARLLARTIPRLTLPTHSPAFTIVLLLASTSQPTLPQLLATDDTPKEHDRTRSES